jgi:F0F1-type ATP synthase assembly protein I
MHAETPRLADKTIVFSEHEVFKVVVTIILLRIFLQMKNVKNPLKIKYHF